MIFKIEEKKFLREVLDNIAAHDQSFQVTKGAAPTKMHYLFTQANIGTGKFIYYAIGKSETDFCRNDRPLAMTAFVTENDEFFCFDHQAFTFINWEEKDWEDINANTHYTVRLFEPWFKQFCADYVANVLIPFCESVNVPMAAEVEGYVKNVYHRMARQALLEKTALPKSLSDYSFELPEQKNVIQMLCGNNVPYDEENRKYLRVLPERIASFKLQIAETQKIMVEKAGMDQWELDLAHCLLDVPRNSNPRLTLVLQLKRGVEEVKMQAHKLRENMLRDSVFSAYDFFPRSNSPYTAEICKMRNNGELPSHKNIVKIMHGDKVIFDRYAKDKE